MRPRGILPAGVAVFIVYMILDWLLHGVFLESAYKASLPLWRPEAEMGRYAMVMWLGTLFYSFFFVFVFTKGYEGRGIAEGIRFGLYMGLLIGVPVTAGFWASMPIPNAIAGGWLAGGVIENMAVGAVAASIYRPILG
ncbi:MAG: hypothetical protein JW958_10590 [Candidatus Eisenbacteria bacterium]|nr:hypothetical protein [Candidatus Eisenbacteria bacterium]